MAPLAGDRREPRIQHEALDCSFTDPAGRSSRGAAASLALSPASSRLRACVCWCSVSFGFLPNHTPLTLAAFLPSMARRTRGLGKPKTFRFLGFVFICGHSRKAMAGASRKGLLRVPRRADQLFGTQRRREATGDMIIVRFADDIVVPPVFRMPVGRPSGRKDCRAYKFGRHAGAHQWPVADQNNEGRGRPGTLISGPAGRAEGASLVQTIV